MELRRLPDRGQHGPPGQRRLDGLADLPRGRPSSGGGRATAGTSAPTGVGRRRAPPRRSTSRPRATAACARPPSCWASVATRCAPCPSTPTSAWTSRRSATAVARGPRRRAAARSAWRRAPGTVNTGAIDPLDALADLCADARTSGSTSTAPTARSASLRPGARAALRRARARRLAGARSAQVALRAGGVRLRAGPRRRAAPRHVQPGAGVPADRGGQGLRRAALVLGVRLPADARLPGPQALDDPPAPGPGRRGRADPPPRRPGAPARGGGRRRARPRAHRARSSYRSCASASRRRDGRGTRRDSTR